MMMLWPNRTRVLNLSNCRAASKRKWKHPTLERQFKCPTFPGRTDWLSRIMNTVGHWNLWVGQWVTVKIVWSHFWAEKTSMIYSYSHITELLARSAVFHHPLSLFLKARLFYKLDNLKYHIKWSSFLEQSTQKLVDEIGYKRGSGGLVRRSVESSTDCYFLSATNGSAQWLAKIKSKKHFHVASGL